MEFQLEFIETLLSGKLATTTLSHITFKLPSWQTVSGELTATADIGELITYRFSRSFRVSSYTSEFVIITY